jgi:hypothetical protein
VESDKIEGKKKILLAGAALALGSIAYRSWKIKGDRIFDVSVWGDKTKLIFADLLDEKGQDSGRLSGELVFGDEGELKDVITEDEHVTPTKDGLNPLQTA